jgi:hypothetical protein
MSNDTRYALNAVCPYFTMFPLEYPMRVLDPRSLKTYKKPMVCDPFCGRGTAIFAARLRGIPAYGVDFARVAVAIARAKLASTTTDEVMAFVGELLEDYSSAIVPSGKFWNLAFHEETLSSVCRIRRGLLERRTSGAAVLLRAVMLGALHGPQPKSEGNASYFSNQMPRTFAAKPDYAVRFWKRRGLKPLPVDVRAIIKRRLERALASDIPVAKATTADIRCADSRSARAFDRLDRQITHVITSPPYYGLRTYSQDQWLREWFLGGPSHVDYAKPPGLDHSSGEHFSKSLARVWDNIGDRASERIRLFVRFGGIQSRSASADEILRNSLEYSRHPWRVVTRSTAASADKGKRQAVQMLTSNDPVDESDYVVRLA